MLPEVFSDSHSVLTVFEMLYKPKVNCLALHCALQVRLCLASVLEHNEILQMLSCLAENLQVHVFWFT